MAASAPDVAIRDPELSGIKPTPPAKRANFAEWENVRQADWEDDEVTHYTETVVIENEKDVLGWWRTNQPYPKLVKISQLSIMHPGQ